MRRSLPLQQRLAAPGGIIMAGRDIGTVVLPDADLKLYLDVSVEERARRRAVERGWPTTRAAVAEIEDDLRRRDGVDRTREARRCGCRTVRVVISTDGQHARQTPSTRWSTADPRQRSASSACGASLDPQGVPLLYRASPASLARSGLRLLGRVTRRGP